MIEPDEHVVGARLNRRSVIRFGAALIPAVLMTNSAVTAAQAAVSPVARPAVPKSEIQPPSDYVYSC